MQISPINILPSLHTRPKKHPSPIKNSRVIYAAQLNSTRSRKKSRQTRARAASRGALLAPFWCKFEPRASYCARIYPFYKEAARRANRVLPSVARGFLCTHMARRRVAFWARCCVAPDGARNIKGRCSYFCTTRLRRWGPVTECESAILTFLARCQNFRKISAVRFFADIGINALDAEVHFMCWYTPNDENVWWNVFISTLIALGQALLQVTWVPFMYTDAPTCTFISCLPTHQRTYTILLHAMHLGTFSTDASRE